MERLSAAISGEGYFRTSVFIGWFIYTDVGDWMFHIEISYSYDEWEQISVGNKKAWENPGFLELVKDEINRFGSNYSEALPSE